MKSQNRRQWLTASLQAGACLTLPLGASGGRLFAQSVSEQSPKIASGRQGVVACVHPLASQSAIDAFERGGNAIDAAIAASTMLSVVDGFNSGLGGGGLALVRRPDGTVHAIDGRETAPLKAEPEMFFAAGKPDPQLSRIGPLAAGVPGQVALLQHLNDSFAATSWKPALQSAAEVAESGFVLDANYVSRLSSVAKSLSQFDESARVLLDDQGKPWQTGHRLRQPDLANTLRQISDQGASWFYQGEFAERAARFLQASSGIMTTDDFAQYTIQQRQPIQSSYRGDRVYGFPPPSSGGIHQAQMLAMLADFDVAAVFGQSQAQGYHLLVEVMKRAMADRAYWLGDADFVKVPKGLLDPSYLAERARTIDLERQTNVQSHGIPPNPEVDFFGAGGHTTHLTTADAEGNVVALTQTINTSFGNKMVVPGTGVILNNELDDFSIAPGVRNAFGLLGSGANLIAPGKRPLSSMSPTIVVDSQGLPKLSCGAAGGPKIITSVLQVLVRCLDLGESVEEALKAGRVHHQWSPNKAVCESGVPESVRRTLQSMGHKVELLGRPAVASALSFVDGMMTAGSDPRVPSSARAL